MSVIYCEDCDKHIDTDFNAEHFDDHKLYQGVAKEYFCEYCGAYLGQPRSECGLCNNN